MWARDGRRWIKVTDAIAIAIAVAAVTVVFVVVVVLGGLFVAGLSVRTRGGSVLSWLEQRVVAFFSFFLQEEKGETFVVGNLGVDGNIMEPFASSTGMMTRRIRQKRRKHTSILMSSLSRWRSPICFSIRFLRITPA